MHYFLGMPLPEVAAALDIPYGTAKSRLHYSLAAMRRSVFDEAGTATASVAGGQLA
jgi:DNA-directed RNA polymerase specialized sigma24 family protein